MSRKKRNFLIAASSIIIASLIFLDHSRISPRKLRSNPKKTTSVADFSKYNRKTFIVTNVVDGDTIDIGIPDGNKEVTRVRLWGIDTPETKKPNAEIVYFGPEASKFTKKSTLGKKVKIYLEEHRTRGYYGRLLAYVQLPDGKFLNEVLLQEGFAYADLRFRHSFYHKYEQLEATARREKKGLWQEVRREQLPGWLQGEKPNLLRK